MAGSYNPNNGSSNLQSNAENRGFFSKALRNLSKWGMNYDDMIVRNKVGIGINEDPSAGGSGDMYDFFSQRAIANILSQKSVAYLDKSIRDKMRILREYSIKDEVRDFITEICDEAIVYNDNDRFCEPKKLKDDAPNEIKDRYSEAFDDIYHLFNFSNGKRAWDLFRKFLIDGFLCFEIIWDDKDQNIIGFDEMDPTTLIPGYEPETGSAIWIQNPEDPQYRRIFLDSQIIYISYKSHNEFSETSYVEGLIKPYNELKIIEQTRIMFNMANATHYQKFTVPVKELSRQRAEEVVGKMIANYSETITWDDQIGTVEINGMKKLPYNKQIWFPEGESGTPQFEIVSPEGHNLNENDMLSWFYNALKRASKIPFTRFDKDNGGGNIFSDSTDMTMDEIKFGNFIRRLRTTFKEIILKPIKLQMLRDFPELLEDNKMVNAIAVTFNSNALFEEWKRLNNISKRAEIVAGLNDSIMVGDRSYFHPDFLVQEYLGLTEEQKQRNESLWETKPIQGGGDNDGSGLGGGDFGGGSPGGDFGGDFGGGDFGGDDFGGEGGDDDAATDNTDTDTGDDNDNDFDF